MAHLSNDVPVFERSVVTEVPAGSRAVLKCNSNDYDHNFMLWVLENAIIGPENSNYDESKYKYEVLSGKLHINVSLIKILLCTHTLKGAQNNY